MNLIQQFENTLNAVLINLPYVIAMILGLWIIHFINFIVGYRLNILGIYPRNIYGLVGIIFSPLLHADMNHLFFNSFPLFILLNFVLLDGWHVFYCVSAIIIGLGGLGVWLIGRQAIHIGASGLVMGYWSYLLLNAYQRSTMLSIALGAVCIYYFGSFVLDLIPSRGKSSWEGHLCGFAAGLIAAYACPNLI